MTEIRLERVGRRFPDGTGALDRCELVVASGRCTVIVGPSGSGKTTLLRLIAGLDQPTSGTILMDGLDVGGLTPRQRNVAMVFQDASVYPQMTVERNLGYPLEQRRCVGRFRALWSPAARAERRRETSEILARVAMAAELLELEDCLYRRPDSLSGGQRQRVALGRALVLDPAVLLLDEPLCNLDASLRAEMRAVIGNLQQRVLATMIHVTHDLDEAMDLGDRVAVLNAGRIHQVGTPEEIREAPADEFVAAFLGQV